ncbi:MAG: DUF63 family protein [Candidatus Thermoplasmatota archaeon]
MTQTTPDAGLAIAPQEPVNWRRAMAPGLLMGIIALATAWFALPLVLRVPLAGLALNVALAWGAYTVIGIAVHVRPASHAMWVPALAPWLAAPMLLRMHLMAAGEVLPLWVATTWTLEALSVTFGAAVVIAYGHLMDNLATTKAALTSAGLLGLGLNVVFLLLHIAMPTRAATESLAVFGLAVVAVVAALCVQHFTLRSARHARWHTLAGGAALAVAASQLLDGFVTYLAVVDPFDILAREMHEQMALSAFLLETTGIGYPIIKWILALGLALLLERAWVKSPESLQRRTGTYLGLIFVGLGPALFSTASLLA